MKVRKKAAIEYWLTAASLTLAVAILVVILGAEGGFADRVEKAAVQAQGDVVRIVVPDVEIPNRPVKTYKVFLPSELEAVRESVTMGQDVAGFHGFHLLTPLMAVLGGQPGQGEKAAGKSSEFDGPLLCYAAVTPNYFRTMGLKVNEGRLWDQEDVAGDIYPAVVGYGLGHGIRPNNRVVVGHYPVGTTIDYSYFMGQSFQVVGILAETDDAREVPYDNWRPPSVDRTSAMAEGASDEGTTLVGLDYCAFIPLGVVKNYAPRMPAKAGEPDTLHLGVEMFVRPTPGHEAESIEEIVSILRSRGWEDIRVFPQSGLQALYRRVSQNVNRLFLYVAFLALFLSSVNLANLMLFSIIRQARFIGIKRAAGASRLNIVGETVKATLRVAAVGGVLGLPASVLIQGPLSTLVGHPCRVDVKAAVGGGLFLLFSALVASLYPAWKAASSQPVVMIRFGLLSSEGRRRKADMRSVLAVLGVVVGIATVTTIVAIGDSAQMEVTKHMNAVGRNVIVVREEDMFRSAGPLEPLTLDFGQLLAGVDGVEACGWQEWAPSFVRSANASSDCIVVACEPGFLEVKRMQLQTGQTLSPDIPDGVVIGHSLAQALFGDGEAVGGKVSVQGREFTVTGVLSPRDKEMLDAGYDRNGAVFIPWSSELSEHLFATVLPTREVWARAREGTFAEVRAEISELAAERSFAVSVPAGDLADLKAMMGDLANVLAVLAGFGLVVGTVGVSGLMYVKVAEEIRQIGVQRALGASKKTISSGYLTRTLLLSTEAGALGLLVSLFALVLVERYRGLSVVLSWEWAGLAAVLSVATGVAAGWLPAVRASSINPIEAIRQE